MDSLLNRDGPARDLDRDAESAAHTTAKSFESLAPTLEALARERFGITTFRPGQRELIAAVLAGNDAIGILPTGGGKSLAYELPALVLDGITVVVSPLIALMKDQCDQLVRAHIDPAELDSTLSAEEERACEAEVRHGDHPILYVTPERFVTRECLDMLRARGVALIAVDEAHLVSQCGDAFRPAYLGIAGAREHLGSPPMIALTATATPDAASEIARVLRLRDPRVVRTSVARNNLAFTVVRAVNEMDKRAALMRLLDDEPGAGIVYAATIRAADDLFAWLSALRIPVARYHGDMNARDREESRARFMHGTVRVMVATKAFGMGIDKGDVRWVAHHQFPDSIESYFQEAGRAGRDGKRARCVLLYRLEDKRTQTFFLARKYPCDADVARVVDALSAGGARTWTIATLADASNLGTRRATGIAMHLCHLGFTEVNGASLSWRAGASETQSARARLSLLYAERRAADRAKLAAMMHYAQSTACRMMTIVGHLGESGVGSCGVCDRCAALGV